MTVVTKQPRDRVLTIGCFERPKRYVFSHVPTAMQLGKELAEVEEARAYLSGSCLQDETWLLANTVQPAKIRGRVRNAMDFYGWVHDQEHNPNVQTYDELKGTIADWMPSQFKEDW